MYYDLKIKIALFLILGASIFLLCLNMHWKEKVVGIVLYLSIIWLMFTNGITSYAPMLLIITILIINKLKNNIKNRKWEKAEERKGCYEQSNINRPSDERS